MVIFSDFTYRLANYFNVKIIAALNVLKSDI